MTGMLVIVYIYTKKGSIYFSIFKPTQTTVNINILIFHPERFTMQYMNAECEGVCELIKY